MTWPYSESWLTAGCGGPRPPPWPDGTARLTVQKGRNQPEPATVALTEAPARALRDLQPDDADPATPVFGLTGEALANRVRAAARTAGLGDGFTGHSCRIGMARRERPTQRCSDRAEGVKIR